jgi:DNA helicase-2/ATP-dependent DNA helicase PcrA
MIDFTEGLNDSQKIAVLTTDGPLLIVAGAGAGKTKTVVHRIGHLITKGVSPQAILAVTFTNKAAKEMRERTKTMIQKTSFVFQEHQLPFVSTFHSLGVFILRRFGAFNGTVKKFTMLDDSDSTAIIKEAFQSYGMDPKEHDPRGVKSAISRFANACTDPESLMSDSNPKNRITAKIWKKYISLKREQHALDFDDLLLQTAALLEQDQTVRAWCNETWTHVHIDEYQDTNEVQYRIARALAAKTKNLCVVGDSDQSIYSWRGANIKNILEFEKDYPEATVVLLEENYRSTKNVIEPKPKY